MKRIKMQRFLGLVIAVMLLLNIPTLSNTVYASDVSVNDNANSQSLSNDVAKMYATIDKYTTVWERDPVTGKYSYPITPEANIWSKLNHAERVALCNIPDYVLSDITDAELVELVLDYPLLLDVYAYSSFEDGIKCVAEYFPALDKVTNNNSFNTYLEESTNGLLSSNSNLSNELSTMNSIQDSLKNQFIADYCESQKISLFSTMQTSSVNTSVTTPKGTSVSCIIYGELLTADDKQYWKDYVAYYYPNCDFISQATTNYNCHSYAWYYMSTSNTIWMPYPTGYMTDGSATYVGTSPTANNQRVFYDYSGNEHSGVVMNYSTKLIQSKWGQLPLMSHNVYDCPYFIIPMNTDKIKFYKLNLF